MDKKHTLDLNSVFIQSRPILEMELLLSTILYNRSYKEIDDFFKNDPIKEDLIKFFDIPEDIFVNIIDRYYTLTEKIIPIFATSRSTANSSTIGKKGNINAYTLSRIPLFFALDRLKIQFLLIDKFIKSIINAKEILLERIKIGDFDSEMIKKSFAEDYFAHMREYIHIISPQMNLSKHKLMIIDQNEYDHSEKDKIDYVMRGIKSSLLVNRSLFRKIDVPEPFVFQGDHMINAEKLMLNQDFIPTIMPNIINALQENNLKLFDDLIVAFGFMMDRVLIGINNAIATASNNQIRIDRNELIYYSGDILK